MRITRKKEKKMKKKYNLYSYVNIPKNDDRCLKISDTDLFNLLKRAFTNMEMEFTEKEDEFHFIYSEYEDDTEIDVIINDSKGNLKYNIIFEIEHPDMNKKEISFEILQIMHHVIDDIMR